MLYIIVILAAIFLDDVGELLGPVFLGAPEHQVFEQMRDAGPAELLVARTHVVEDAEGRNRSLVIFQHQHSKAVGQGLGLDCVGYAGAREARGERGKQ